MKTLADLLRHEIADPIKKSEQQSLIRTKTNKETSRDKDIEILESIRAYEYTGKNLLHPRIDDKTVKMLSQFKIATGVDMNKVIAYSIDYLFIENPELKQIIKTSLENFEL